MKTFKMAMRGLIVEVEGTLSVNVNIRDITTKEIKTNGNIEEIKIVNEPYGNFSIDLKGTYKLNGELDVTTEDIKEIATEIVTEGCTNSKEESVDGENITECSK